MAWLGTWANRIELLIHNANVDNTLYNFPILVSLSASSGLTNTDLSAVFSNIETTTNRKKIAITDYTGTSQHYVEIERWDQEASSAQLWVNVPEVHTDRPTLLYLYYDKNQTDNTTYIGDVGATPAQQVWNSNFIAVYNLNQDPSIGGNCILESTVSGADSGTSGAMPSTALVTGAVGKALLFDGVDDNVWGYGDNTRPADNFSFECICKTSDTHVIYSENNSTADCVTGEKYVFSPDNKATNAGAGLSVGTNGITVVEHGNAYMPPLAVYEASIGTEFNYICIVYIDRTPAIYLNGTKVHTGLQSGKPLVFSPRTFGSHNYGFFEGVIDNVRFSKISLSDSWVKATHYSNTDSLVIFRDVPATSWLQTYEGGELSPWAKRIKLEIDNTKVDNSLVNFPTLINIGPSSGYNNIDIRSILTELDYGVVTGDDFTGVNGEAPNTYLWSPITGSLSIESNKLRSVITNAIQNNKTGSNFKISGDFDIQVDYTLVSVTSIDTWNVRLYAFTENYDDNIDIARRYGSGDFYFDSYNVDGGGYTTNSTATTNTTGKLRLRRVGSTVTSYYWGGSDWVTLSASLSWVFDDVTVSIYCNTATTAQSHTADFDNFTVNSGTLYWPQSAYPYRKKLAVTSEDGTTQLPVEIDYWDATASGIQLWTSVPHVKSDETTNLYLYYDVDKTDNTDYIGDTGSTIGQSIWDDNFIAVYHMNEIDTVDSTNNSNTGAAAAGIENSNIIDGQIAKAIHFDADSPDASTDYIDLGSTPFNNFPGITVECMYKPTVLPSDGISATAWHNTHALVSKYYDGADRNFRINCDQVTDKLMFQLSTDTLDDNDGGIYSNNAVVVDTTYYVVGCWSGYTNETTIHVDGQKQTDTYSRGGSYTATNTSPVYIGADYYNNFKYTPTDGDIDEVRMSDIVRSNAWIETTSYSNYDTLIYYNAEESYTVPVPDAYFYHGHITENNVPIVRTVLLYNRSTGELMESTTSDASGYYLLETPYNENHFIVVLDDDAGEDYDALIQDRLPPNGQ